MRNLLSLVFLVAAGATAKQPHIVIMLVDDMGWNDVSFHGSNQIPTPNMDALGFGGMVLQRHYTLPSCTPSRSALLTGKYPIRTGLQGPSIEGGVRQAIPLDVPLLPERLKELGYTTRMVGKWQLGLSRTDYTPLRRGFDSHFGCLNGNVDYFRHRYNNTFPGLAEELRFAGFDLRRNWELDYEDDGKYLLDLLTEEAERVVREHDDSKPLFLYFPHLSVHRGNDSIPAQVRSIERTRDTFSYINDTNRQLFADLATDGDRTLRVVIDALRDKNMLNDSIILLAADNGAMPIDSFLTNFGSNWPLRGTRGTLLEGGVRCLAAVWSPHIQGRRVSYEPIHLVDWLPTLYRAAGGNPDHLGPLDGKDMWDYLTGNRNTTGRDEILINIDEIRGYKAIISGKWKWIQGTFQNGQYDKLFDDFEESGEEPTYDAREIAEAAASMGLDPDLTEDTVLALRKEATISCNKERIDTLGESACLNGCLFNIIDDPCEIDNVAEDHPDIVQQLLQRIDEYEKEVVPQTNTPVDPLSNPDNFDGVWQPWLDSVKE